MDRSKQAFPVPLEYSTGGMTLREYAAVAAMQAILSNGQMIDSGDAAKWVADTAISHADALLARLEESTHADH